MLKSMAEIVRFPSKCGDVVAMLRKLADDVESGEVVTQRVVVVIDDNSGLQVRGFGDADATQSIAMLQRGVVKMCEMANMGDAA